MEEQRRGQLTERIKKKSVELLGYEISLRELRLMPYVQYCVMNSQNLDPNKVNQEERDILSKWRKAKYISGGAVDLEVSKKFWDVMSEILWLGYVDLNYIEIADGGL